MSSDKNFEERFLSEGESRDNIIYDEHFVRYELARTLVSGKVVLDIASGTGYGSHILSKSYANKVVGVDVSKEAVRLASEKFKNDNLDFVVGDAESLSFEDDSFDLVVSFETIEHLQNPQKFLEEIKRVLKNDGHLLISTPNYDVSKNQNPYHLKEYTKEEFERILEGCFKKVRVMEQENALVSRIRVADNFKTNVLVSEGVRPTYFVAICSNNSLPLIGQNFVSINYRALSKINNNPGFKLVNKVYSVVVKIPGVKKLLGVFNR